MGQIVCPRCGQPNADTANACGHCGCFLKPYPMNNISPEAQNYPPQGQNYPPQRPTAQNYPPQGQPVYPQGQGYPPRPLPAMPIKREPAERTVSDFFSLWKASGNARKAKAMEIVGLVFTILGILFGIPFLIFIFCMLKENYVVANYMVLLFVPCAFLMGFSECVGTIFAQITACLRILNCSDWMHREHIKPDIFAPKLAKGVVYHYYRPEKRGVRIFLTVLRILLGCVEEICLAVGTPLVMTGVLYIHELQQAGTFNPSLADIAMVVVGNLEAIAAVLVGALIINSIIGFIDLGVTSSYIKKKRREAVNESQKNTPTD